METLPNFQKLKINAFIILVLSTEFLILWRCLDIVFPKLSFTQPCIEVESCRSQSQAQRKPREKPHSGKTMMLSCPSYDEDRKKEQLRQSTISRAYIAYMYRSTFVPIPTSSFGGTSRMQYRRIYWYLRFNRWANNERRQSLLLEQPRLNWKWRMG